MNWTSLSGAGSSPIRADSLSTPFHKYNHVCDEGFLAQTRRERRAYPSAVCKERATTCGPKSTVARRVASLFGSGFVAPRSQPPLRGMLPRRASPEPKIDATNVVVFMKRGTKRPGKKLQIPNSRLQTPEKLQARSARRGLELGTWRFFGVWSLVFGVSIPGFLCRLGFGPWCFAQRRAPGAFVGERRLTWHVANQ